MARSAQRQQLLRDIADRIPHASAPATRVAIDGVDGAGKSVLADELAAELRSRGRPVIRICADDFLNERAVRYRRGRTSPEGFWLDSYNYDRLRADVLDPLSPGGDGHYRTAAHDLRTDTTLSLPVQTAEPRSVLVLDGLFLHRDELVDYWDLSIWLHADVGVTVARMAQRDASPADPNHPSLSRYVQGQRLYLAACDPAARASIVIDNNRFDEATITRG